METKLTAHLPTVDVEITRRKLPEAGAESVAIHITAVPSVEAAAQWFLQPGLLSAASPLSALSPFSLLSPLSLWSMWMRAWQPWFAMVAAPEQGSAERDRRLTDKSAAARS
ncbi:hypothetical protein J8I87_02790 [Paraburkholderia sp. LEh10]|uniref:hypothetical protein n=1 Tax=Paraburkholderia sp. LEh10 TaxID=2821353 RepID=UPI001AE8AC96|nr:hypothetical protein [Paraburkholderia sp. LEh10]MBP0588658.1 hypothetical protein [Paraburkholderia sp. LEh10]